MLQVLPEVREKIQETCTKMSMECGKALQELATAIRTMKKPSSADSHIANSTAAAKSLRTLLKSGLWEDIDLLQVIPAVTVASLLLDVVNCTEKIAESVHELASLAHFETVSSPIVPPEEKKSQQPNSTASDCCPHVVVTLTELPPILAENKNMTTSESAIRGRYIEVM